MGGRMQKKQARTVADRHNVHINTSSRRMPGRHHCLDRVGRRPMKNTFMSGSAQVLAVPGQMGLVTVKAFSPERM